MSQGLDFVQIVAYIRVHAYGPRLPASPTRPERDGPAHWPCCVRCRSRPHCTAEEVAEDARAEIGDHLATGGLRRPRDPGREGPHPADRAGRGRRPSTSDRVGDNHHHLICRACGKNGPTSTASSATPRASNPVRQRGLPDRRGGGDLLGHVSRMSRGVSRAGRATDRRRARGLPSNRQVTHTAGESRCQSKRHEVPVHRRGPETHGRRRHDQPRLVAEPAEARPPEPAFVQVRSDGRGLQLRGGVQEPRPGGGEEGPRRR